MSERVFPRLSDGDIRKILRELDIADVRWFLLDADEEIRKHVLRVFNDREMSAYREIIPLLDGNNAGRRAEGRERFLYVLQVLIDNGEIIPSKDR